MGCFYAKVLPALTFEEWSLSGNTRWKEAKTRILSPRVRGIVHVHINTISADFDTDGCLLTWRAGWAKPSGVCSFLPGAVTWRKQTSPQNKRTGTWKAHWSKKHIIMPYVHIISADFFIGRSAMSTRTGGESPPGPPLIFILRLSFNVFEALFYFFQFIWANYRGFVKIKVVGKFFVYICSKVVGISKVVRSSLSTVSIEIPN